MGYGGGVVGGGFAGGSAGAGTAVAVAALAAASMGRSTAAVATERSVAAMPVAADGAAVANGRVCGEPGCHGQLKAQPRRAASTSILLPCHNHFAQLLVRTWVSETRIDKNCTTKTAAPSHNMLCLTHAYKCIRVWRMLFRADSVLLGYLHQQ